MVVSNLVVLLPFELQVSELHHAHVFVQVIEPLIHLILLILELFHLLVDQRPLCLLFGLRLSKVDLLLGPLSDALLSIEIGVSRVSLELLMEVFNVLQVHLSLVM